MPNPLGNHDSSMIVINTLSLDAAGIVRRQNCTAEYSFSCLRRQTLIYYRFGNCWASNLLQSLILTLVSRGVIKTYPLILWELSATQRSSYGCQAYSTHGGISCTTQSILVLSTIWFNYSIYEYPIQEIFVQFIIRVTIAIKDNRVTIKDRVSNKGLVVKMHLVPT